MQDIHSMGAGRLFTGGGGGDRRLRPHQHQNHQVLKCPRCDSLNTKFCYYNNYNLSQPRHFCKNCRRYWTKGGVLRNVPVGGGCRKTKRSKPKPSSERERTKSNSHSHSRSHSSSESSSLTATTTAAVTPTTTTTTATTTTTVEAVSAHSSNLLKMNNNNNNNNNNSNNSNDDSKYFEHVNPNNSTSFEHSLIEQGADCGIFSEIGSFTSLITSTNETLSFGFNNIMNHHHHHQQGLEQNQQWQQQQQKMVSMGSGGEELKMQEILDQTLQVELSALQNRSGNGGFGSLDWQGSGGDQGLFDLPNAVDQSYWSQSQWSDQDHPTLYLP